mmetsp:Transcript_23877/g.36290  ORF Transcript_23877/g.36290 Transcript_23877/m.36290 type:complete len:80 (+) Transcript_23877:1326-1565(+)
MKAKEKESLALCPKASLDARNIETEESNYVEKNNCSRQHGSVINADADADTDADADASSEDDFHLQLPLISGFAYSLSL